MNCGGGSICGVTVTHHPDAAWPARVSALAAEVARVVVVDNGSGDGELAMVRQGASRTGAHLIRNERNLGFAAALNQAASWAFAEGHRWLLLLDQDSEAEPGIGEELRRVFERASARGATAVVGSNFLDQGRGRLRFEPRTRGDEGWMTVRTVIASGSLVEREAYRAIGPFREEFSVDSVDHDFCLRARARGFQVALATRPLIRHRFGASSSHRVLGRRVATTNHSAERRYLMGRNRAVLAKEYLLREPRWVTASIAALLSETVVVLFVETERGRKLRAVVRGAWDGVRGRLDRAPALGGA